MQSLGTVGDQQPNYMKMTFATSRNVAPNSSLLQMSSMLGSLKQFKNQESGVIKSIAAQSETTLLKQIKPAEKSKKE